MNTYLVTEVDTNKSGYITASDIEEADDKAWNLGFRNYTIEQVR